MSDLAIVAGPFSFVARLEEDAAPRTCTLFRSMLPFHSQIIQARWSGRSAWIPMGFDRTLDLPPENATSIPLPGQILLYPGGVSEVEILFPYGATYFASVAGPLAGNHFLTVVEGQERLEELGELVLWKGAQEIVFEIAASETGGFRAPNSSRTRLAGSTDAADRLPPSRPRKTQSR